MNSETNESIGRRGFLTLGASTLTLSLLSLQGCGGGGGSQSSGVNLNNNAVTQSTRATVPPDPAQTMYADAVCDGEVWTDKQGHVIDIHTYFADKNAQPHIEAHTDKWRFYIWQPGWGWHWLYVAYDTGHPFGKYRNNQPHLNLDRYNTREEMDADERDKNSGRAQYVGHFTAERNNGSICMYYYVSKDKKYNQTGTRYDNCINTTAIAEVALVVAIVLIGVWLAPALIPAVALLPAFA